MRRIKGLLLGTCLLALSGGAFLVGAAPSPNPTVQDQSYWRHHDGKWSHWDARDKRWYYTDGNHWYWHNGKVWEPYRFDRKFGRDGFEHGKYAVPGEKVKVIVPTHEVYVPR